MYFLRYSVEDSVYACGVDKVVRDEAVGAEDVFSEEVELLQLNVVLRKVEDFLREVPAFSINHGSVY